MVVSITVTNHKRKFENENENEEILNYIKLKSYKLDQYLTYDSMFQEGNHLIKNGCIMKVVNLHKYDFDNNEILNFLGCNNEKEIKIYYIYDGSMMIISDATKNIDNDKINKKKINYLASDIINSSHAREFNITNVVYVPIIGNAIWIK